MGQVHQKSEIAKEKNSEDNTKSSTTVKHLSVSNFSGQSLVKRVSPKEMRTEQGSLDPNDPKVYSGSNRSKKFKRSGSHARSNNDAKISELESKAWIMAHTFEAHLRMYLDRHFKKVFKTDKLSRQALTVLIRACANAEALNMDYDTYVRSQFWWFDKWFSKAPRLHEIASVHSKVNSLERARRYRNRVLAGHIPPHGVVLSKSVPPDIAGLAARFNQSMRTMERFMRNYKASEEQIFRAIRTESLTNYFDAKWLAQNATYQRLKAAGEI